MIIEWNLYFCCEVGTPRRASRINRTLRGAGVLNLNNFARYNDY